MKKYEIAFTPCSLWRCVRKILCCFFSILLRLSGLGEKKSPDVSSLLLPGVRGQGQPLDSGSEAGMTARMTFSPDSKWYWLFRSLIMETSFL